METVAPALAPDFTGEAPARRETRSWLLPGELAELTQLRPGIAARDIALLWLGVFATFSVALWAHSWAVFALAFISIASFQNALTLWTHEATHYNLTRRQKLNDNLGDFFMAGPIGLTVGQYRWHHVPHHRHLNDPEFEVNPLAWTCLKGGNFIKEIALTMLGKYGVQAVTRYSAQADPRHASRPNRTPAALAGFATFSGLLFLLCVWQGQWWAYFLLWIAPVLTLTLLIGNLRTIVEHQPSSDVCEAGMVKLPAVTRVVRANWLERLLIAPIGLHYHYEHHLYAAVPYHRLREVRRRLVERGYYDANEVVRGEGYIGTILKIALQPGYGLRLLNPLFAPTHDHDHGPEQQPA